MPLRRKHPRPWAGVLVLCRCNHIYGFVQKKTKKKHSPISLRGNICYNDEEERHLPLSSSEYPDGVERASPREQQTPARVSKEFYGESSISAVGRRRALFGQPLFFVWHGRRTRTISMQMSGGHLLADGLTAATHLFFPSEKMQTSPIIHPINNRHPSGCLLLFYCIIITTGRVKGYPIMAGYLLSQSSSLISGRIQSVS